MTDQLPVDHNREIYRSVVSLPVKNKTRLSGLFHSVHLVKREQRMKRENLSCFLLRIVKLQSGCLSLCQH